MKLLTLEIVRLELKFKNKTTLAYTPHNLFIRGADRYIIDYDVLLKNGKNLQRDFCWTVEQKRELIISILKGIKLPNFSVVLFEDDSNNTVKRTQIFKIIDGKQRLSTIEKLHEK